MKDTVNFGILGTGRIAGLLCDAVSRTPGARVYAVASRTSERAAAFSERYGGDILPYGTYEALCGDPDVDIVYVATPHGRHFADASLALSHGKNVLCEKAFTINHGEAETLVDMARSGGLFLCEAMWPRFSPVTIKVREWIASGAIGEVVYAEAEAGFRGRYDPLHRLFDPALGGGALLDMGVYPLAFVSAAFDCAAPVNVYACANMLENGVDGSFTALLDYGGGRRASVSASITDSYPTRALIFGTEGRIEMRDSFINPTKAALLPYKGEAEIYEHKNENGTGYLGYEYEAAAVTKAIKSGKTECEEIKLSETLKIMQTVDEIKQKINLKYPQDKE